MMRLLIGLNPTIINYPMNWYIIKNPDLTCHIIDNTDRAMAAIENWGPYASREDAIAKRIGLIRAGKCDPA
jgi:hypothetical protein